MGKASGNPNWARLLEQLAGANIEFLVVGGAALVLHGLPRTTLDVDIYIPSDPITPTRAIRFFTEEMGLEAGGAARLALSLGSDSLVGQWLTFSIPDGPDIIDLYICRTGEFNTLMEQSELLVFGNCDLPVASLSLLKQMKAKCARPIDLADIALIKELEDCRG